VGRLQIPNHPRDQNTRKRSRFLSSFRPCPHTNVPASSDVTRTPFTLPCSLKPGAWLYLWVYVSADNRIFPGSSELAFRKMHTDTFSSLKDATPQIVCASVLVNVSRKPDLNVITPKILHFRGIDTNP